MSIERITKEQFDTETANIRRRGVYVDLVKSVVDTQEIVKIVCADSKKAKGKVPGLSVIRKKHNFQVRFNVVGNTVYISPGVFVGRQGTPRKKKDKDADSDKGKFKPSAASRAAMGLK